LNIENLSQHDIKNASEQVILQLDNMKIRPWNIFKKIKELKDIIKGMMILISEMLLYAYETAQSMEVNAAVDLQLDTKIQKLWKEVYEREELRRSTVVKDLADIRNRLNKIEGQINELIVGGI
jgi:hypothetical protein